MNLLNTDARKSALITLLIVAAGAIVYGQVVGFDFINIDDRAYAGKIRQFRAG
jgi:hypothetical protein